MLLLLSPLVVFGAQQSLFKQVVPSPTMKNGYEEYVRAAEIASTPRVDAILLWQPGKDYRNYDAAAETKDERQQSRAVRETLLSLNGKTPLQVKRQLLGEYKTILQLIREGNLKPVAQPRTSIDFTTTFPEFRGLRAATRVAVQCSDALLANGQSAEAARVLTDFLEMSTNLPQDTLISNLVGLSCESLVLAGFYNQLDRYSEVDWRFIADRCSNFLDKPLALDKTLAKDAEVAILALDGYIAKRDKDNLRAMFGFEANHPLMVRMDKMSLQELQEMRSRLAFDMKRSASALAHLLSGPESKWRYEPGEGDSEELMSHLMPSYDQVLVSNARARTQLRLLRLHALIQIYRWQWNELPSDFSTFGAYVNDPLSDGQFQFERTDTGYRLYSKGNSATGEVELRYRRPAPKSQDAPPN